MLDRAEPPLPPRGLEPAVVLLSGGLDSCVAAAWARSTGAAVHGISFAYGQRHGVELEAAAAVCTALGLSSHRVIPVGLDEIGGSSLTAELEVPKDRPAGEIGDGIPNTYVPARNTVFLSLALGLAEVLGASRLIIGANALDYSGYPDCREPFLRAFETLADLATATGVQGRSRFRIEAPLLHLTKAQIVRLGADLGAPLALTHSCYDPVTDGAETLACGRCDSCELRARGFREAGVPDPTAYVQAGPPGQGAPA